MLRRATRYADAVVVPTHAMAGQLAEIAPLGARIRVIPGAAGPGFDCVEAASARESALGLPERYVAVLGRSVERDGLASAFRALAGLELDVVVVGDADHDPVRILALAQAEGIPEYRVRAPHVSGTLDRAGVLAGASVVVSASRAEVFPWRMLEALAVGAPIVAVRAAQSQELLADAAKFVRPDDPDEFAEAIRLVTEDEAFAAQLRVLSADRSRAFSWRDAAERVWQLHAEL